MACSKWLELRIVSERGLTARKAVAVILFVFLTCSGNLFVSAVHCQNPADVPSVATVPEGLLRKLAKTVAIPKYPAVSKRRGKNGVAVSDVSVDEKGNVTQIEVIEAPDEEIKCSVAEAIKRWKFLPANAEGKPVRLRSKLTFYFLLEGGRARVESPRKFAAKP